MHIFVPSDFVLGLHILKDCKFHHMWYSSHI